MVVFTIWTGYSQRSQGPARASPPAVLGQLRTVCDSDQHSAAHRHGYRLTQPFAKWRVVPVGKFGFSEICLSGFLRLFPWTFLLKIMVGTHKVMSTAKILRETSENSFCKFLSCFLLPPKKWLWTLKFIQISTGTPSGSEGSESGSSSGS